ncbi:MAG TPA: OsmC family protein [Actinotalea sp.]|nr:OsmC family protein [Actinotalea sp.]
MTSDTHRSVDVERIETGVYLARNDRGGELRFGSTAGDAFTPVELLLAAIAGCSAVDVDVLTGRRSAPEDFRLTVAAEKVRDSGGNILKDIVLSVHVTFPEGEDGDAAREILPRAVQVSHDRTCTVSRTIEAGVPVSVRLD